MLTSENMNPAVLNLKRFDLEVARNLVQHYRLHPGDWDGLRTGYSYLDRLLRGLKKKRLVVVAARPSLGKTTFGLNIALNVALAGGRVAFFSQEMDHNQVLMRLAGMISGIPGDAIESGKFSVDGREWPVEEIYYDRFLAALETIGDLNLRIHEGPISTDEMRRVLHPFRHQLDLVLDDHIGWHTDPGSGEYAITTHAVKALKRMADTLVIPIIAISQLSRGVESREDKHPLLSDLRNTGEIEQSADVVIMLYRDGYYMTPEEGKELATDKLEAMVRKNRDGKTGVAYLAMAMGSGRIAQAAEELDMEWAERSLGEVIEEVEL